MLYRLTIQPTGQTIHAGFGDNLLAVLRSAGLTPDAPCGGSGRCGKCKVLVDGKEVLACQTSVVRDMTVTLPPDRSPTLSPRRIVHGSHDGGCCLAFDIGTTTVVCYLLNADGTVMGQESALNPQIAFGADVITRIRHAVNGEMETLTDGIRRCADKLARALCQQYGIFPEQIETISVVGNPAMEQIFLGILPENLATLPFAPVLTHLKTLPAASCLPHFSNAQMLVMPNISGFVGGDTIACLLAANMDRTEKLTLLVDIGTNGEMVLGNKHRMVACSTAAGPALEGAGISCGMRAMTGAIDHVWREGKAFGCSVIGGGDAAGICGSGLVDAMAAALNARLVNCRGRIEDPNRVIPIGENVVLTQEDVRQLQQAKGAIAAGIHMMTRHLGVTIDDIEQVYLAGAFGSFLSPASLCRIGLLPQQLLSRIVQIGNAAGDGAMLLLQDKTAKARAQQLAETTEHLSLASATGFQRCFADCMRFTDNTEYWCRMAESIGFTEAAALDVHTLQPRADIRAMCAEDKCGAFGKNWTCPPHCGTLEECTAKIRGYHHGIVLQTVGKMEKAIDTKAFRRAEQQHLAQFHALAQAMSVAFPDALFLGSGGCRICPQCAYPQPCRHPESACSSMEGYGLFVTQVCRDNGLSYHHGDLTITYTACVLF